MKVYKLIKRGICHIDREQTDSFVLEALGDLQGLSTKVQYYVKMRLRIAATRNNPLTAMTSLLKPVSLTLPDLDIPT